MGVITEITRRFRGDPSPKEKKEFKAAQIWGAIGKMVGKEDGINFRVESKLEKTELPEDLRDLKDWEFYDRFEVPFTVAVSSKFGHQQIAITTTSFLLKMFSRRPGDTSPTFEQGYLVPDATIDFPFPFLLSPQDHLEFASDLSRFVLFHWRHNQPQTPQVVKTKGVSLG